MNNLSKTLVKQIREELIWLKNTPIDYTNEFLMLTRDTHKVSLETLVQLGEEALCGKVGGHDEAGGQKAGTSLEERAQHVINNEHRLNKSVVVMRTVRRNITASPTKRILAHWLVRPTRLIHRKKN